MHEKLRAEMPAPKGLPKLANMEQTSNSLQTLDFATHSCTMPPKLLKATAHGARAGLLLNRGSHGCSTRAKSQIRKKGASSAPFFVLGGRYAPSG